MGSKMAGGLAGAPGRPPGRLAGGEAAAGPTAMNNAMNKPIDAINYPINNAILKPMVGKPMLYGFLTTHVPWMFQRYPFSRSTIDNTFPFRSNASLGVSLRSV